MFLQLTEVARPINMGDETIASVCLRGSTDDQEDKSLRRVTGGLKKGGLDVKECSKRKSLQTLYYFVDVLKGNHVNIRYTERIPWILRRFQLEKL